MKTVNKFITAFLCGCSVFGLANDLKYRVVDIPAGLMSEVDFVIRTNQIEYVIKSQREGRCHILMAVTILNNNGSSQASHSVDYDKLTKIKTIRATVYDASGKQVRKLKSGDIHDQSAFDGFSLFSDDRMKSFDLRQNTYPYTVEIEYDIEYAFQFSLPTAVLNGERRSTQYASYKLTYPPELKPHIKTLNIERKDPVVTRNPDGTESEFWAFENIVPNRFEPFGPSPRDVTSMILAAPNKFEYEGYEGDMSSWTNYGKWALKLNEGRDALSEKTKQKVKELTTGLTTQEEKARVLYAYVQSKTRYVSISLGIGGLQPFPASVVDEVGYGDCKALSNYMVALLKEAGVKGYYTKVQAGKDQPSVLTDFPSHQSNHVIVCIPNKSDTLWLECTSQTNPFGYQGTFTDDRKALMITESGGQLVNTTRYTEDQTKQICSADVRISMTGDGQARTQATYSGLQYEQNNLNFIVDRSYDDQKKWIQKYTSIPTFDVASFSISSDKQRIPTATVRMELRLNRFATISGKRFFVTPNLLNRINSVPQKMEHRKLNVYRKMAYTDIDTIRYSIPEELYPEFLPEPVSIQSIFGTYEMSFTMDQGKVVYVRKLVMKKGVFPPDSYNELVDFLKKISRSDNSKLVFLNKT